MTEPNITINPYNDSGIFFNDDDTTLLHYGGVKKIDINSTHEEIPTAQAVYEFHKMNQDINIIGVPPIIVTKDEQKNEGKIVTNSISLNVQFQKIMFNNGIFVAISSQGGIATSVNKTDWSFQKSGTTNDLLDIVYTQGKFIIIGENGTIITSSDGITWILQLNAPSENLLFIVAYNDNIVITGSNNVYHSTDAETWTSTLSPAKQVIVCNNQFIALDNVLHTSNDGITWTANLAPSTQLYSIAYSTNENIYFTGDNANFYSSSDLNEWIILSPVSGYIVKIIYENGKFYAISSTGYIYWGISTNMQQSTAFNKTLTDIIYEDGIFYVVGNSFFGYSFDGETWQEITTDVIFKGYTNEIAVGTNYIGNVIKSEENDYTWYLSDVISPTDFIGYSNGVIGVGNNGYLVKSSDGKNWISSYITTEDLNKIVFNGTNYFICGTNGYLASSNDLNVWNVKITNIVSPILNMATNGNIVIAISYTGYVISSTNGGETFIIYQVNNNTWSNIIYGNGTFVISGNNNGLITTTDGINFTTINLNVAPSGQSTVVNDLTYGNNLFIGYRYNDIYIYSNDNAVTWIEKTFPVSMFTLNKIKFLNGNFIAVGYTKNSNTYSFTVLYSTDAEIWNLVVISSFTSVIINIDNVSSNDIEFDGTNYYIIGSGHNIYMSNDLTTWIQQTIIVDNYASNNPFYKCLYTSNTLFVSNRVDMIANNETIETFDINEILNGIYNLTGVLENKAYGNGLLTSSSPKNTWDIIQFPQTIIYLSAVGDFSISYYSIYSNFSTIVHTSTHILNKIYYLNNIYIVVGDNVLITSNDSGTTWTEQTITYNAVAALYYIDYVIIGSNGTVDHSSDLSTWINLPITDTLVDGIVVGTNIYILGQNTIYTTSDFTSWTPILISNINPLKKLITNGILITQSEIFSSNDMLTWTNENQTGTFNDVSFNTDATVIVGSQITSKINESENYAVLSIPGTLNAINNMIAVGSYVSVIDTHSSETISTEYTIEIDRITGILRSGDDSTGSDQDLVTDGYLQEQLEKVNEQNKVIVEGEYPIIVTKETDGSSETKITSYTVSLNSSLNDIYYANSMYIAVGKTGTIMTSFNGENWSYQTSTVTYDLNKIIYDGTYWIAIGNHGIIITSSNGIDWIKRESNTIENLLQIKSKNETSIIIGSNAFLRSIDSITWESITSSLSLITNLFLINDNFIVSDNNNYIYSSNGQTWSTLIAFSNLSEAIYGINNYVFGTFTGSIFTSASLDGPWTSRYASTNNLTGSIYVNNIFYFGSTNNVVISSPDTISWTNTSTSSEIHGFSYDNDLLYGYGTNIFKFNGTNWNSLMTQNVNYITKINNNVAVGNNFIGKISTQVTFGEFTKQYHNTPYNANINDIIHDSEGFITVGSVGVIELSNDGKIWEYSYNTASNTDMNKIILFNGTYVVGGFTGTLFVSNDRFLTRTEHQLGVSSTDRTVNGMAAGSNKLVIVTNKWIYDTTNVNVSSIVWNTSQYGGYTYKDVVCFLGNFVAITSDANVILYSTDNAVTWNTYGTTAPTNKIKILNAAQGGAFIVFLNDGTYLYSFYGNDWHQVNLGNNLYDISLCNFLFVGVGQGGVIYSSDDFAALVQRTSPTTTDLTQVAYGENTCIATGENGVLIRSSDGINWTLGNSNVTSTINKLLFANGNFFFTTLNYVYGDTVPRSWVLQNSGTTKGLIKVIYGNNIYVAVGYDGTLITSSDGENWTSQSAGTSTFKDIIYANNIFVAIGDSNTIRTSTNGITWTARSGGVTYMWKIIYGKDAFFIVDDTNGNILRSVDGITWTNVSPSSADGIGSITYNSSYDRYIAVGNGIMKYSTDGINWTTSTTPYLLHSVFSNGTAGDFACGSDGLIVTMSNYASGWIVRQSSASLYQLYDTCVETYGNITKTVYTIGRNGQIFFSRSGDMSSWSQLSSLTTNLLNDIYYANNTIFILGNGGYLYEGYTDNTISIDTIGTQNLESIVYGNGKYVIVGDNGTIYTSEWNQTGGEESIVDIILSDISPAILGTIENSSNEIIGYGSTTLKTTDKKTWQMLTKPADYATTVENIIQKVIKISDNLYIGIYANYLYSSIDAINWTIRIDMSTLYGYSIFMDVIYAGDLIVAVGAPGAIWTSSDGINWTQQNNGIPNYTYQLTVITYVNSTYYISGWDGTFFRSSDAITWLNTPSLYSSSQDLIYNKGKFYIVCNKNNYAGYYIVSSPDTITWTELGTIDSFDYQRISKNGTIATTNTIDGKIYDTNDFLTWNNVSYTPVTSLTSVYFENNTDIVTGLNNVIIRGEDKIWNSLSTGINELLINTNYIDNSYISCGQYLHILNVETISGLETKYIVSIAPPNILKAGDVSTGSDTDLVSDGYLQEQLQFEKGEVDIKAEYPIIVTKEYEEGTGGEMMISTNTFGANVTILDMSYAKNLYVAVGSYGMIMTSSDKKNWTYQNSNTNAAYLLTIIYDGTQWIATGTNGFIITSTNGSDWITRNTGTASSYSHTITNNGTTITCSNGSAQSVMKSTDGENWIEIFNSSNVLWCGYVNNKFFITFGDQTIVWSDDNGVTWSTPVTPLSGNSIRTIYYHNGIYFAGANTFVVTSPDLINWTQRLNNGGTITLFFTVNNMVFVGSLNETVPYCYDNDLINWNKFNIGGSIRQVLYENNIVHALGYKYGTVFYMTSSDGLNWIQANISKLPTFEISSKFTNNIIYGNGYIGEKINMTSQLSTFTYQNVNSRSSMFYDVLGDENGIILIGSSGMIVISDNGKIWNSVYTNTQINAYRIIKFNSTYIIGYSDGIVNTSTDRTTWTSYQIGTFGDNYTINDMIVGDNLIIIAMNNGNIGTSSDLTTWSSIQYGTYKYTSVTYNNGMYVLSTSDSSSLIYCSGDPTILSSWNTLPVNAVANKVKTLNNIIFAFLADGSINYYNGSIWTNVDIGNIINDIEYNSGLYVVVGQTGSIYTSSDLTTWTQRTSSTTNNLNYILYANSIYTVTGNNGTLLQSSNAINWQMIDIIDIVTIINYTKLLYNQNHIWFMSSYYFYGDVGTRVWKSRVNPVGSQKINKVIYGNSFIAVGGENTTGYILESIDGNIWNLLSSGNTPYIDIAYYNQIYIIISSDKVVRIDENGVFNETTISGFTNMKKIIYGNNGFFIINSDGKIAKSTANGTGWTTVSSDIGSLNSISYATYYVAVGENMIKYSNDGLTWTTITTSYVLYDVLQSINDYKCYACGKNGLIVISTDLSTWNVLQTEDINKTDLYHMGVNPVTQTYYAVGSNGEAYSSYSSYFGQTPVVFPLNTNNTLNNVMFVNNTLFIVGNSGYLFEGQNNNYKNNDGFITQNNWQSIAYGNETYVMVADNGAIYSTEYDTIEIPQANINSIITNNLNLNGTLKNNVGDVIAYGTGVITTTDKKIWPMILNPSNQTFIKIIQFSNNIYTSFDNNGGIYVSSDLKNWTLRYIIENMTDMIYENNILIMTGNHDIYTSTTFLSSWDWRYTGPETVKKIIYNAGIYVIIDINGAIIRSIDTITWISSPSGLSTIADISVVNGKFFIIGSTGSNKVIYSSSDALTWTQETIISSTNALIAIDNSGTTISNNQLFDNTYNNVPITVTPAPTLYSTYFANNINVVTGTRGFIYVKINDIWEQFTTNYSYIYGLTNTNYIDNTFISVGDFIHFINITYSGSGTTTYTVSIAPPLSIVTNILKASNVSTESDTDLVSDGYLQSQLSNIEIEKVWTTEDIGSLSTVLTQYYFAGHNTIINNIVLGSLYPNIIIANIDGTVINTIAYPANMTNFNSKISANTTHMIGYLTGDAFPENIILYEIASNTVTVIPYNDPNPELTTVDLSTVSCDDNYIWYVYYSNSLSGYTMNAVSLASTFLPHVENSLINSNYSYSRSQIHIGQYLYWHNTSTEQIFLTTFDPLTSTITSTVTDVPTTVLQTSSSAFMFCRETNEVFVYGLFSSNWMYKFTLGSVISIDVWNDIGLENQYELRIIYNGTNYVISNYGNLNQETIIQGYIYNLGYSNGLISGYTSNNILFTQTTSTQKKVVFNTNPKYQFVTPIVGGGVTTIDVSSTNDYIPTAKAVYSSLIEKYTINNIVDETGWLDGVQYNELGTVVAVQSNLGEIHIKPFIYINSNYIEITNINSNVLSNIEATRIFLPESIKTLSDNNFSNINNCVNYLSNSFISFGNNIYSNSNCYYTIIPEGITTIGNNIVNTTTAKYGYIPDTLISSGSNCFTNSQLAVLSIPNKAIVVTPFDLTVNTLVIRNYEGDTTYQGPTTISVTTIVNLSAIPDTTLAIAFPSATIVNGIPASIINDIPEEHLYALKSQIAISNATDSYTKEETDALIQYKFSLDNVPTTSGFVDGVTYTNDIVTAVDDINHIYIKPNVYNNMTITTIANDVIYSKQLVQTINIPPTITTIGNNFASNLTSANVVINTFINVTSIGTNYEAGSNILYGCVPDPITSLPDGAFSHSSVNYLYIPRNCIDFAATSFNNTQINILNMPHILLNNDGTTNLITANTLILRDVDGTDTWKTSMDTLIADITDTIINLTAIPNTFFNGKWTATNIVNTIPTNIIAQIPEIHYFNLIDSKVQTTIDAYTKDEVDAIVSTLYDLQSSIDSTSVTINGITYTLNSPATVTTISTTVNEAIIKSHIFNTDMNPVTTIATLSVLNWLGKLEMPETITTIGDNFLRETNGIQFNLSNSLTTIGINAFYNAQMKNLIIPQSLVTLGDYFAYGAVINYVKLPATITTIPTNCFINGIINIFEMPNVAITFTQTIICNTLIVIDVSGATTKLFTGTFTAVNIINLTLVPNSSFSYTGTITNTVPPETPNYNELKKLEQTLTMNRYKYDLYGISNNGWLNGIRYNGGNVISAENISELIIKNSVDGILTTVIADAVFMNKSNLKKIIVPDSIKTIGNNFANILTNCSIILPESIELIGSYAYANSNLPYAIIPEGITTLYINSLNSTIASYAYIPDTLTTINANCFVNSSFQIFNVPNITITTIDSTSIINSINYLILRGSDTKTYNFNVIFANQPINIINLTQISNTDLQTQFPTSNIINSIPSTIIQYIPEIHYTRLLIKNVATISQPTLRADYDASSYNVGDVFTISNQSINTFAYYFDSTGTKVYPNTPLDKIECWASMVLLNITTLSNGDLSCIVVSSIDENDTIQKTEQGFNQGQVGMGGEARTLGERTIDGEYVIAGKDDYTAILLGHNIISSFFKYNNSASSSFTQISPGIKYYIVQDDFIYWQAFNGNIYSLSTDLANFDQTNIITLGLLSDTIITPFIKVFAINGSYRYHLILGTPSSFVVHELINGNIGDISTIGDWQGMFPLAYYYLSKNTEAGVTLNTTNEFQFNLKNTNTEDILLNVLTSGIISDQDKYTINNYDSTNTLIGSVDIALNTWSWYRNYIVNNFGNYVYGYTFQMYITDFYLSQFNFAFAGSTPETGAGQVYDLLIFEDTLFVQTTRSFWAASLTIDNQSGNTSNPIDPNIYPIKDPSWTTYETAWDTTRISSDRIPLTIYNGIVWSTYKKTTRDQTNEIGITNDQNIAFNLKLVNRQYWETNNNITSNMKNALNMTFRNGILVTLTADQMWIFEGYGVANGVILKDVDYPNENLIYGRKIINGKLAWSPIRTNISSLNFSNNEYATLLSLGVNGVFSISSNTVDSILLENTTGESNNSRLRVYNYGVMYSKNDGTEYEIATYNDLGTYFNQHVNTTNSVTFANITTPGTLTSNIFNTQTGTIANQPINNNDIVNKIYVDEAIADGILAFNPPEIIFENGIYQTTVNQLADGTFTITNNNGDLKLIYEDSNLLSQIINSQDQSSLNVFNKQQSISTNIGIINTNNSGTITSNIDISNGSSIINISPTSATYNTYQIATLNDINNLVEKSFTSTGTVLQNYSSSSTTDNLNITLSYSNVSTGETTTQILQIPVASATNAGIITSTNYNRLINTASQSDLATRVSVTTYNSDMSTVDTNITNLKTDLTTEITNRTNSDTSFQGQITAESQQRTADVTDLQSQINNLTGVSTVLQPYDFGTPDPTQQELTDQAAVQGLSPVTNGTFITNLNNMHQWVYNTNLAIWTDLGISSGISVATNTTLGLVKGSLTPNLLYMNTDGTATINNLFTKVYHDFTLQGEGTSSLPLGIGASSFNVLYISNTYSGIEENGSEFQPYKTIQACLDYIETTSGNISVQIAGGTYTEDVIIKNITRLTIRSDTSDWDRKVYINGSFTIENTASDISLIGLGIGTLGGANDLTPGALFTINTSLVFLQNCSLPETNINNTNNTLTIMTCDFYTDLNINNAQADLMDDAGFYIINCSGYDTMLNVDGNISIESSTGLNLHLIQGNMYVYNDTQLHTIEMDDGSLFLESGTMADEITSEFGNIVQHAGIITVTNSFIWNYDQSQINGTLRMANIADLGIDCTYIPTNYTPLGELSYLENHTLYQHLEAIDLVLGELSGIDTSSLTPNTVLTTNATNQIISSTVTSTELQQLINAQSNIQDQLNLRLARIINYNADLNNALFGMYQIITDATNTPPNENVNGSLLIVYQWDTTNIRQIYYPNNSQKLWSRSMINGIWQSWLLISNGTYTYQSLTYTAIPIANLTATIAALPSTINHTVTINLTSASTVASVVTINNLQGLGSLIINGNASSLQRLILQNNTLQQIIINNIIATDTTQNYAFTIQNNSNAVTLNSIQATGNSLNANPSSGIAIIDNTGNVYVNNSTFSNKAYGIYSYASDTLCSNITLSNNTNGYYSTNGSFIHVQSHNETLLDTAHFNQQLGGVIFMPDGTIFAVATSEVENEQPIQNGEEISITKDTWEIRFISQNNGHMPLNLILVNNDVILHSIAWQLSQRVGNVIRNVSGNPNIAAGGQITLISNYGQSNSPMAVWDGTIGDLTTNNFYSFKTFYVPATGSFKCTITKH